MTESTHEISPAEVPHTDSSPHADLVAKGSYGTLSDAGDGLVVKCADLFDPDGYLISENLNEAIVASYLSRRDLPRVIRYTDVELRGRKIRITQERACGGDLHAFIENTPFDARKRAFRGVFMQVLEGVHALHEHGILHGDLNPRNVVLLSSTQRHECACISPTCDRVTGHDLAQGAVKPPSAVAGHVVPLCDCVAKGCAIIDLGSCQLIGRHNRYNQICTFPYAPPEMFEDDDVACLEKTDAYSLGALVYEYFYKQHLYDTVTHRSRESVRDLHRAGAISAPTECPSCIPRDVFEIMRALLHPDPAERLGIRELHHRLADVPYLPPAGRNAASVSCSSSLRPDHATVMDLCKNNGPHAELTCELITRYGTRVERLCDCDEIAACMYVARSISENRSAATSRAVRAAITDVLTVLGFDLLNVL